MKIYILSLFIALGCATSLFSHNAVVEITASIKDRKQRWTGFIINQEGHILTSCHQLLQGAPLPPDARLSVNIAYIDGYPLDVTVVDIYPSLDIALLKLTDASLQYIRVQMGQVPHLELGDSDQITRAQNVTALGYALGLRSVHSIPGVIAGREFINGNEYISSTAHIFPGNGGGPLIDAWRRVIGVNMFVTQFISVGGFHACQNMSYAVPINDVKKLMEISKLLKALKEDPASYWSKVPNEIQKEALKFISFSALEREDNE